MARVEIDIGVLKADGPSLTASATATVRVVTRGGTVGVNDVTWYTSESAGIDPTGSTAPITCVAGRIEAWVTSPASLDLVITDGASNYTQRFEAVHSSDISTGGGGAATLVTDDPYNAVGNGTADDTAAINAALTASKHVAFPPGTYSTPAIYNETGGLSGTTTLSGIDVYSISYHEFSSLSEASVISGVDSVSYQEFLMAPVSITPFVSKDALKNLEVTQIIRPRLKDDRTQTALTASVDTSASMSRVVTIKKPYKPHRVRELV